MKRFVTIIAVSLATIFLLVGCGQNPSVQSKTFLLSEKAKIPETTKMVKVVRDAVTTPVATPSPTSVTPAPAIPAANPVPKAQPKVNSPKLNFKPRTVPVSAAVPASGAKLIVVTKSTFTLQLYENSQVIRTYQVTIGRDGHETPQGKFLIGNMIVNPEYFGNSSGTVGYIPGGAPNNPLGSRWMGINYGPNAPNTYGFHEEFYQTGRKASSGCIRLFRADLEDLYSQVSVGTPVWINP